MKSRWFRISVLVFSLFLSTSILPVQVKADASRVVELVTITARVGEQMYTMETIKSLAQVAQSSPVNIEARIRSTASPGAPIELISELDSGSLRWQTRHVRTGEAAWKYGVTRLRLPPPPFDLEVRIEGRVRIIEDPSGVFKPFAVRLFRVEVGNVAEFDFQVKATHATAIVLSRELENVQVPVGPPSLSSFITTLKQQIALSLDAGKISEAESKMAVLKDLAPVAKAIADASERDKALVTTMMVIAVFLTAIAVGGWLLWVIARKKRPTKTGGTKNACVNDKLESLWR